MLYPLVFALAAVAADSDNALKFDGVAFGPRQTLTCEWFTNFENSRLEKCWVAGKNVLPSDDGASIKCVAQVCKQLDDEARRVSNWKKPEAPWGSFTVTFVGRVSPVRHTKQYLGDGTSTVLIEKIISVRKSN